MDQHRVYMTEATVQPQSMREATLEAIFASIADSFLVLDGTLVIVEANNHLITTLGADRNQVIGRLYLDVFPHAADTGRIENLKSVLDGGEPHRGRIPLFDAVSGVNRLYDVATYPVCDRTTSKVTHLLEYTREVTEEVRAQLDIMDYNQTLLDIKEQLEAKTAE